MRGRGRLSIAKLKQLYAGILPIALIYCGIQQLANSAPAVFRRPDALAT